MRRPPVVLGLALIATLAPLAPLKGVLAQTAPVKVVETPSSGFNLAAVRDLISRGDAAAAAGNLTDARKFYDQARESTRRLLSFYRDLSGAFRGLDARIPREMDQNGKDALEVLAQINLRLAAVFRRLNQPEVAVPLLVEVVKTMTPASDVGRKAYQSLVELGFASIPYGGGTIPTAGS